MLIQKHVCLKRCTFKKMYISNKLKGKVNECGHWCRKYFLETFYEKKKKKKEEEEDFFDCFLYFPWKWY